MILYVSKTGRMIYWRSERNWMRDWDCFGMYIIGLGVAFFCFGNVPFGGRCRDLMDIN